MARRGGLGVREVGIALPVSPLAPVCKLRFLERVERDHTAGFLVAFVGTGARAFRSIRRRVLVGFLLLWMMRRL